MEIGSSSLLGAGSRCCSRILVIPLVLLCCTLICCLGVAGFFINAPGYDTRLLPGPEQLLPVLTVPAIPVIPSRTPAPGSLLDLNGTPLFGSAGLESGFSPDPYSVDAVAGGSVDTAGFTPACGYTSYHPAFVLDWQGSSTDPFLRIFFTPNDDTATTLLVHTPGGEWLCEKGSVLDLPSASSGEYAIWLGTRQDGAPVEGSLSITGSEDVMP